MQDHLDRYQRGTGSPGQGRAGSATGVAMPGKRTLAQGLAGNAAIAPIQRKSDVDHQELSPSYVQVDQYQRGTDPTRFKDCGPACIVMALRAMGAERQLREHMNPQDPDSVTLEQELEHVRNITAPGGKDALSVGQVKQCLIAVLREIGVPPTVDLQAAFAVIGDVSGYTDTRPANNGRIQQFLDDACADGSAALVMGRPIDAAWGWGGTVDNAERRDDPGQPGTHQMIGDQGGSHFVLVWRPPPEGNNVYKAPYVVMDPSWPAPKWDITFDQILAFIDARDDVAGKPTPVNIMKVPYAQVAAYIPPAKHPRVNLHGREQPAQTRRGVAPGAPIEDAGAGAPLPAPTRYKMEDLFGTDLSAVRVHEGGAAPAAGATAYAQGNDLHFAPGRFQPGTPDGDRLIGHELAHVVQQREGRVALPANGGAVVDHPGLEAEADQLGDRVADGRPARDPAVASHAADGVHTPAAPVQRQEGSKPGASPSADSVAGWIKLIAADFHQAPRPPTTAEDSTDFGKDVMGLWLWCKLKLPAPGELDAYLHGPVNNDRKRQTIGRLAVRRGRLEFLIGWLLQGGIRPNGQHWESWGSNAGPIVSQYETGYENGKDKTDGEIEYRANGEDWCGMFVAFCFGRLEMTETGDGSDSDHMALESSYRADTWLQAKLAAVRSGGKLGTGERIIRPDAIVVGPPDGATPSAFTGHPESERPVGDPGPQPQAGDVAVFAEHIAMIESYDPSRLVITTIEGNIGLQRRDAGGTVYPTDSVSGYRYSTRDFKAAYGGLLFVWRPSLEAFGATTTGTSNNNAAGEQLVQSLDDACTQITDLYQQLNLPGAPVSGQPVADITRDAVAPGGKSARPPKPTT